MSVLTNAQTTELVIPVKPTVLHRTIEHRGDSRWHVVGMHYQEFTNPFDALMALRVDVERTARHPVRVEILWRGVPADFHAPTTGDAW